jgi:hypothetical protein
MADQFITRDMKRSNRNLLTTGVIFALAGALLFFVASQNVGTDRAPALVWGIILSCCALVPLTALAFRLKTAWHPTWRAAARYGDPYLLDLELGLELADSAVARVKSLTVTPHWLLRQRIYGLDLVRLEDVMWAYRLDTQHYVNGIKGARTIEVKVHTRNGTILKVKVGREHLGQRMLQQIQSCAPWAVVGYSAALEATWKSQRAEFITVVDGRRAAVPSDAPRVPAPVGTPTGTVLYPSTKGSVILLLGIIGVANPLGLLAWLLGHIERREATGGRIAPSKAVNLGWALGIVDTVLFAFVLLQLVLAPHQPPVVPR